MLRGVATAATCRLSRYRAAGTRPLGCPESLGGQQAEGCEIVHYMHGGLAAPCRRPPPCDMRCCLLTQTNMSNSGACLRLYMHAHA